VIIELNSLMGCWVSNG